ncbi:MAG: hypothetical protein ACYC0X_03000 [Pirellulaceae bacterium]
MSLNVPISGVTWVLVLSFAMFWDTAAVAQESPTSDPLAFAAGEDGVFTFDTGVMRGRLRGEGRAFGLNAATHVPSGQAVSGAYGVLGVYRVFSDGKRYGNAGWDWPSEAVRNDDGSVTVQCAAEPARPFVLRGLYRWSLPAAVDLEIEVTPVQDLHAFEVFVGSYFDAAFTNAAAYVAENPQAAGQPGFLSAQKELGYWLMFPRDAAAVTLIQDGRWELPPNPVDWTILPRLGHPLAMRRVPESRLTTLLMTRPEDGFAIAMPFETEGHFSVYLSLFGQDIAAGQTARAVMRLQVLEAPEDEAILEAYRGFLKSAKAR